MWDAAVDLNVAAADIDDMKDAYNQNVHVYTPYTASFWGDNNHHGFGGVIAGIGYPTTDQWVKDFLESLYRSWYNYVGLLVNTASADSFMKRAVNKY